MKARLASAGEILVPADQPDLISALDAAAPGDTIRVQTTADQAPQSMWTPITIDKPITIIGEPVCSIEILANRKGLALTEPISGEVVLSGLKMDFGMYKDQDGGSAITGGGFDALHLVDCIVKQDVAAVSGTV
jgi:hypothetical protein